MDFGTRAKCDRMKDIKIAVNNEQLTLCDKTKYLGVILDPQLSFEEHVNYFGIFAERGSPFQAPFVML